MAVFSLRRVPPPQKRPTLSFAVTLTHLHQKGQNLAHKKTQSYKTHIAILKLFHIYLFNFSYKSDMLILRHSHITAVFVSNDVQRRRQDIDHKFASVERIQC